MKGSRVRPIVVTRESAELGCRVRRVAAYIAECPCGWASSSSARHADARAELRAHIADEHRENG